MHIHVFVLYVILCYTYKSQFECYYSNCDLYVYKLSTNILTFIQPKCIYQNLCCTSSPSFMDFMGHHLVIILCKKCTVKILHMSSLLMPSEAPTWGGPTCH